TRRLSPVRPAARLLIIVCIGCFVAAMAAGTFVVVRGCSPAVPVGRPEGLHDDNPIAQGSSPALRSAPAPVAPDFSPAPAPDVLLSRQLAADHHLHVGDVVTLAADPRGSRATRFRVAG